jgi:hypothetical protein
MEKDKSMRSGETLKNSLNDDLKLKLPKLNITRNFCFNREILSFLCTLKFISSSLWLRACAFETNLTYRNYQPFFLVQPIRFSRASKLSWSKIIFLFYPGKLTQFLFDWLFSFLMIFASMSYLKTGGLVML